MEHVSGRRSSENGKRQGDDAGETGGGGHPAISGPEAVITPYRDGPLLVRGPFRLQDQDGAEVAVGRSTVALCRCGKSRIRPFCDGTHRLVRFRAPSEPETGREAALPPNGNGPPGAEG